MNMSRWEAGMKDSCPVQGRIQKFPDLSPGARTANDVALCH